ncbi:unnamed protein product, partial [Mesorhabditis belari]|uniref:Uncharacterized protein n=1 Tax=Mesorhabditis belari TaxID=2138241 RepID=A0AAF3FEI3_9BILA
MQRSKELESRCRLLAERVTDSVRILDHDPSLALYRLQEHVGRTLSTVVQRKIALQEVSQVLSGVQFDLDNALATVENMKRAGPCFERSHELLRSCMYFKQHIDYEKSRSTPNDPSKTAKGRSKSFHGQIEKE